jgi:hypoxanthine phosphoribosyltransferase
MRQEVLTWHDVDKAVDYLVPQFHGTFDAMLLITRGGIIPGGLIAEAINNRYILTAAVRFPDQVKSPEVPESVEPSRLLAWPEFLEFPAHALLAGRRVLVVDDVWGSGRTITAVKGRVVAAGGQPELCVFHYNPHRSLFKQAEPDYYAAITDAYIVYPWEVRRDRDRFGMASPRS